MKKLRPPIKTHSGKYYLASWIIENFPENYDELQYIDMCCGGCSVFLNKKPSEHEFINDKDKGVTAIFKALRDEPKKFIGRMKRIKYSETTFNRVLKRSQEDNFKDYYELALNEFILRRMSRNGLKKSFAWTNRIRGGKPGDINAWETIVGQLQSLADRIQNVTILNEDFCDLVSVWNEEDVFMFIDPPNLPEATDGTVNEENNEMSVEDYVKFLTLVKNSRAKVMICGHDCVLFNKHLEAWNLHKKKPAKNNSGKKQYRLWTNY
jgi:DNA adenine methylase